MKNFCTSVIFPTGHCFSKHPQWRTLHFGSEHSARRFRLHFQQFVLQ
jgi:hypothetical protein